MSILLRSVISGIRNKLMKIIQIIHCRFLKDENRVTKYLNMELKLLSMVGLFQLPYSLPGQSTLQQETGNSIGQSVTNARPTMYKLYMGFSFSFYATLLILNYICVLTKSSKEFIEFSTAIVELAGMTMIFSEVILFNSKRSELIDLLERMDKFDVKSQRRIFISCRRLERLICFGCNSGFFLMCLLKFSFPFFPIDAQSAAHVQSIYGFKYPQNRLPMCLGLPFVDTSEPRWFYVLYVLEIYAGLIAFGMCSTASTFFPCVQIHLVGQHFVLALRLETLGKSQLRSRRHPYQQRVYRARQVLEMKECIVFHQKLLEFRTLFDCVSRPSITLQLFLTFINAGVACYLITVRSQFSIQEEGLIFVECIVTIGFIYYHCIMSEIFEWVNWRIRYAVYQSQWYTLCPDAQRMVLMFLRRTQRSQHFHIVHGMIVLTNSMFIRTIRAMYSFVQFMGLRRM